MFSFGLTWSAYNWLLQEGVLNTFMIIASIQVVVCAFSIPMCKSFYQHLMILGALTFSTDILGKKNRSFMQRHDLLKLTGLW